MEVRVQGWAFVQGMSSFNKMVPVICRRVKGMCYSSFNQLVKADMAIGIAIWIIYLLPYLGIILLHCGKSQHTTSAASGQSTFSDVLRNSHPTYGLSFQLARSDTPFPSCTFNCTNYFASSTFPSTSFQELVEPMVKELRDRGQTWVLSLTAPRRWDPELNMTPLMTTGVIGTGRKLLHSVCCFAFNFFALAMLT
jgi:hypothetical protein